MDRIGSYHTNSYSILCSSDSWINHIEGGVASNYYWPALAQFTVSCSDGQSLESRCGEFNLSPSSISNEWGMDQIYWVTNSRGWVYSLKFSHQGVLVGSFLGNLTYSQKCPEGQIITGVQTYCGTVMDGIRFWCDSRSTTTRNPSRAPTVMPTGVPTWIPTTKPSRVPSSEPTEFPSGIPTKIPSKMPSSKPSEVPTKFPTVTPSQMPSTKPTEWPTQFPSMTPSRIQSEPTEFPTGIPTLSSVNFTERPISSETDIATAFPIASTPNRSTVILGVKMKVSLLIAVLLSVVLIVLCGIIYLQNRYGKERHLKKILAEDRKCVTMPDFDEEIPIVAMLSSSL